MANGIMTGTGVQSDPYLIEDVFDFCVINSTDYPIQEGETHAYFKLVSNIDFNDHPDYKMGINNQIINYPYAYIYADEQKEIRNMVSTATIFSVDIVENINFPNIIATTMQGIQQLFRSNFKQCNFYIYLSNSGGAIITAPTFTDCTICIGGSMTGCISIYKDFSPSFVRSRLHFDNVIVKINTIFSALNCIQSYFDGRVIVKSTESTLRVFANGVPIGLQGSYFAIEISSDITERRVIEDDAYSAITPSFIDKDIAGISGESKDNFYLLTTAQAQNAEYLNSIGFLVT